MSESNNNHQQPSLVGGHVQYVKGTAEAVIGDVTGSTAWKESGAQDKKEGLESMKDAGARRDPDQGYGKVEEVAGKITGCGGMEKEGFVSKRQE